MLHVGQNPEPGYSVITIKQFDQGVSIGNGRRLVTDHQQDLLRSANETDYRFANPRRGINHQHIERVSDVTEDLDQACVLRRRQMRQALDTRCSGDNMNPTGHWHHHIGQLAATFQQIGKRVPRGHAQQYTYI